jgi:hypothetical protein
MKKLHAHAQNTDSSSEIYVDYKIQGEFVHVLFEVSTAEININEKFSQDNFDNFGLWDFDVVEVFIQKENKNNHYLELQISPANQKFALLIKKPRIETESYSPLNSKISSTKTSSGFKAEFFIHIDDIPGNSEHIKANFFCCLGPQENKSYFALNINQEVTPDFHRPELFISLGSL